MRNNIKRVMIAGLIVSTVGIHSNVGAMAAGFSDLKEDHWATPYIKWGVNNKIVSGYPDKTYKKDKDISESEFTKMVYFYGNNTKDVPLRTLKEGEHWATAMYEGLSKYNLSIKGNKDSKLTRGDLAKTIASMYNFKLTEEQAVYFIYQNDLASGMEAGKTLESYGKDSFVKREQIPKFMKALMDKEGPVYFMEHKSPVEGGNFSEEDPKEFPGVKPPFPNDKPAKPVEPVKPPGGIVHGLIEPHFKWIEAVANKHGVKADSYEDSASLKGPKNSTKVTLSITDDGSFSSLSIREYTTNKAMARDLISASGLFTKPADIEDIFKAMDEHIKPSNTGASYKTDYKTRDGKNFQLTGRKKGDVFLQTAFESR